LLSRGLYYGLWILQALSGESSPPPMHGVPVNENDLAELLPEM
jgi:hypothetical protein